MKLTIPVICFFCLISSELPADISIDKLYKLEKCYSLTARSLRNQNISIEPKDSALRTLKVDVDLKKNNFFEMKISPATKIIMNKNDFNGYILITVYSDFPETISKLNIRLMDSDGEIFQLNKNIKLKPNRWITVRYDLNNKTKFDSIFGGKEKNKVINYPLTFNALTADFNTTQIELKSNLYIRDINWYSTNEK